jgi:hypothetical protein
MYSVMPAAGTPKVIMGGSSASRLHRATKSFSEAIRARNSGLACQAFAALLVTTANRSASSHAPRSRLSFRLPPVTFAVAESWGPRPVSLQRGPDDAALIELGRLIWSAISLEDFTYHMADAVGLDSYELKRGPVSECIKKVLSVLGGWPESEIRDQAVRWCRTAQMP